jgi:hypothetical protein
MFHPATRWHETCFVIRRLSITRDRRKPLIEENTMAKKKAAKKKTASKTSSKAKKPGRAKKSRSLNAPGSRVKAAAGAPTTDQDPKKRLGNFATAGEHARQGGRTTGIVGQKKSKNKTDKRGKK